MSSLAHSLSASGWNTQIPPDGVFKPRQIPGRIAPIAIQSSRIDQCERASLQRESRQDESTLFCVNYTLLQVIRQVLQVPASMSSGLHQEKEARVRRPLFRHSCQVCVNTKTEKDCGNLQRSLLVRKNSNRRNHGSYPPGIVRRRQCLR